MKKKLIDYSQYIVRHAAPLVEEMNGRGGRYADCVEDNRKAEEYNKKHYYGKRGFCPFCRHNIPKINDGLHKGISYYDVWSCPICGWWEIEKQEFGIPAAGHPTTQEYNFQAIVRAFDVSDRELPEDILLTHLRKEASILYDIHPRKMEEIVKYVFSSYYSCDVIHCGKSHDGGVDLIMIDSDEPTLIQVKRRQNPDYIESVSAIREFLGALLINRSRKGIFVSTTDHYSKETIKTINMILKEDVVTRFELIDFKKFTAIFNIIRTEKDEPMGKTNRVALPNNRFKKEWH